ncbi:hypothetical protein [Nannocystis exedens]|nr:hypothetical protein [Nannocystis exedens]
MKRALPTISILALLAACNGGDPGESSATTSGTGDPGTGDGSTSSTSAEPGTTVVPTSTDGTTTAATTTTGDDTTTTTAPTTDDATTAPADPCEPDPCVAPQNCVEGACVDPAHPGVGEVVLVELMIVPRELSDFEAEWFELKNVGERHLDLDGCTLARNNGNPVPIDAGGPLLLAPGELLLFGRTTDKALNGGLELDYVYGTDALTLNNTNGVLTLACDDLVIDSVEYAAGLWPYGTGDALALDPGHEDAVANDSPDVWCRALVEYAPPMNYGSPGQQNPPCR